MSKNRATAEAEERVNKSLLSEEDIKQSAEMGEGGGAGGSNFLKIPERRAPFYILNRDYRDGFVHWVTIGKGQRHKVVCGGGPEGRGMDTENCKICAHVMGLYKEAKALRENPKATRDDKTKAGVLKEQANDMKAKYEAHVVMALGTSLQRKVRKGGKETYEYEADWSLEEDEDGDTRVQVGVLSLTNSQMRELSLGLVENAKYPFMKSKKDLLNRVIWSHRGKNESGNAKVFWIPEAETSDVPVDEEAWKEIDISKDFEIDQVNIDKTFALITGEGAEEPEEDGGDVELEDSEEESSESASDLGDVGDGFLDDDPEEDLKTGKAKLAGKEKARPKGKPAPVKSKRR